MCNTVRSVHRRVSLSTLQVLPHEASAWRVVSPPLAVVQMIRYVIGANLCLRC
jgi:hypothetical protein